MARKDPKDLIKKAFRNNFIRRSVADFKALGSDKTRSKSAAASSASLHSQYEEAAPVLPTPQTDTPDVPVQEEAFVQEETIGDLPDRSDSAQSSDTIVEHPRKNVSGWSADNIERYGVPVDVGEDGEDLIIPNRPGSIQGSDTIFKHPRAGAPRSAREIADLEEERARVYRQVGDAMFMTPAEIRREMEEAEAEEKAKAEKAKVQKQAKEQYNYLLDCYAHLTSDYREHCLREEEMAVAHLDTIDTALALLKVMESFSPNTGPLVKVLHERKQVCENRLMELGPLNSRLENAENGHA